jgi:hypothetical protein
MTTLTWLLAVSLLVAWLPLRSQAKGYSSGGGHSYSSSSSSHSSSSGGSHSSSSSGSHSFSSGSSHSSGSGSGHTFSSGSGSSFSSGATHSSSSGGTHSSSLGGSPSPSAGSTHSASVSSGGGSGSHSSSPSSSVGKSSGGSASQSTSPSASGSSTKSFLSGSGKSYGSGSTWNDESRHSYTAAKSYSAGGHTFVSGSSTAPATGMTQEKAASSFAFDTAAARARKEETSKQNYARFKEPPLAPPKVADPTIPSRSEFPVARPAGPVAAAPSAGTPSYRVQPPPIPVFSRGPERQTVYIPDSGTISTRPVRIYNVFNNYSARPVVTYHDPYGSLFWWWLLERSLDDRAYWAYHHRYDMAPARYQALVANDQQLEARVEELEAQQVPRDPNYTPAGLDRDLMYTDHHVTHAYSNRPTLSGEVAFWVLCVPTALAVSAFFIWLIWFKRWQPAT